MLENEYVHVQGYCCPLLSFFIGLGQRSMFLAFNEKNNAALRTVIKTLSVSGSSVSGWQFLKISGGNEYESLQNWHPIPEGQHPMLKQ